jgi:hypothetical protein
MRKEKDTIHQILINNKYDPSIIEDVKKKKKNHQKQNTEETEKTKWAKFTYVGKETRFIPKVFKRFNIKIAFNAGNTIEKLFATKQNQEKNKYEKSGIYQLTCPNCDKKYIGQTGSHSKPEF